MTRGAAMLLAPHAGHLHSLMAPGLQLHAVLLVLALAAVCAAAAVAVRREGQR
jgi:hypothetical protein